MKKQEQARSRVFTRRALLVGGGQAAMMSALGGRMYYLQVLESDKYVTLAEENRVNLRLLAPPRGLLVDRFGTLLALNKQMYRVVMIPEQAGDIQTTLDAVGKLVQLTEQDRRRVLREIKRKPAFLPIMVRSNLTWDEVARVEVNVPELPGVTIEEGLVRQYPYGETASHILGYVSAVSEKDLQAQEAVDPLLELPDFRIGKDGVEKFHDTRLRGKAGTSQVEVNAYGRVVRELKRKEGAPGDDTVLTLDMAIQEYAYRRCYAEKSASCVLLDSWTGDVLSLVSSPGYDPEAFSTGITQAYWNEIKDNERAPLRNKALAGQYAPGSTFKCIVALAALENGLGDMHVGCGGVFNFANVKFHCWKKEGHGGVGIRDAIKRSCDVWFYTAGARLGIDKIAAVANRFGLGVMHDFDVPGERPGIIPSRAWKQQSKLADKKWHDGETISCSIGQSYVSATPLQLAVMTARLVTGRAVAPRITRERGLMTGNPDIDGAPAEFTSLNTAPKDLKVVLDGMWAVCNEPGGTAYSARITDPAMAMGGKSGSSQVRRISASERDARGGFTKKVHEIPWKERDHALFVSFAPAHAPRYVCSVVVEHGGETTGGGSAVAAPICRDVLRLAQQRDPARKVPPPEAIAAAPTLPERG